MDHTDLVAAIKAALEPTNNLATPCGAFKITKRVAWALRSEGAGLLAKPAGNNCEGYSVDVIMYPSGMAFDVLGDAGNANIPMWNPIEPLDPARWRPPLDPGDLPPAPPAPPAPPTPPAPPAPPPPTDPSHAELVAQIAALTAAIQALAAKPPAPPPAYTGRVWGIPVTLRPV